MIEKEHGQTGVVHLISLRNTTQIVKVNDEKNTTTEEDRNSEVISKLEGESQILLFIGGHLDEDARALLNPNCKLGFHFAGLHFGEARDLFLQPFHSPLGHFFDVFLRPVVTAFARRRLAARRWDLAAIDLDDFHTENESTAARDLSWTNDIRPIRIHVPMRSSSGEIVCQFEFCLTFGGEPLAPYAKSLGMYISHLSPSTISCMASVQPLMTWLGAKEVG